MDAEQLLESRCTGHCCEAFFLPFGPEELAAKCYDTKRYDSDGAFRLLPPEPGSDVDLVEAMAIYLGHGLASDFTDAEPVPGEPLGHYYTCRWYDDETGNCGNYEARPRMCRAYPYGKPCTYSACTWTAARQGLVDADGRVSLDRLERRQSKAVRAMLDDIKVERPSEAA